MKNGNRKILIIEDEPDIREILCRSIGEAGFHPIKAEDGEKGLELFKAENPDVVIVDMKMPGISGLEVMKEINRISPEAPIIVVSGAGIIKNVSEAVRYGAVDFFTKPVDMFLLHHALKREIERASLKKENFSIKEQLEKNNLEIEEKIKEKTADLEEAFYILEKEKDISQMLESRFHTMVYFSREGMLLLENDIIRHANYAICEMLGHSIDELDNKKFMEFISSGYHDLIRQRFNDSIIDPFDVEIIYRRSRRKFVEVSCERIENLTNINRVIRFYDISNRIINPRTGLIGESSFLLSLRNELCKRTNLMLAVIYVDINGLKDINNTYGHSAGDELINRAARTLKDSVREADIVSHLHGDEFALLLTEIESESVIQKRLENIIEAFNSNNLSACFGIRVFKHDAKIDNVDHLVMRLMDDADRAMFRAKKRSNMINGYEFFNHERL